MPATLEERRLPEQHGYIASRACLLSNIADGMRSSGSLLRSKSVDSLATPTWGAESDDTTGVDLLRRREVLSAQTARADIDQPTR